MAHRGRSNARYRFARRFFRLVNPLASRMIAAGRSTGAPNVLLTVQGRKSGVPRTAPVGVLTVDGRRFLQAAYTREGWAANLRAAGEAVITEGTLRESVETTELTPAEAAPILQRVLQPYRRSRVLRAMFGPQFRPPVYILQQLRVRVNDTLEEYIEEAGRNAVFEIRPKNRAES